LPHTTVYPSIYLTYIKFWYRFKKLCPQYVCFWTVIILATKFILVFLFKNKWANSLRQR
jgi:hypothetical protein